MLMPDVVHQVIMGEEPVCLPSLAVIDGAIRSYVDGTNMNQPFVFPNECPRTPITLEIRATQELAIDIARVRSQHVPL